MNGFMRTLTACLLLGTLGCSNSAGTPALARLQEKSPVVEGKFKISQCKSGDTSLEGVSPIHAKRGESLTITGRLESGEWGGRGLHNNWPGESGSSGPRGVDVNAQQVTVGLFVHGDDTSKNLGMLAEAVVDVRPVDGASEEMEFRAKFKAPNYRGKYVVDLQAVDMSVAYRERGEPAKTVPGICIWRRELWVE